MAAGNRLRKGERVEVRSDEAGFLGSWYEATLLKKSNKSCWVRYRTLIGESSDAPLEECVPLAQVRPVPPAAPAAKFDEGDAIEAYDRDGWWVGTVTRVVEPDNKYVVYFRESVEEMEYPAALLRLRQDWHNGIWIRVYEKRNPCLEAYRRKNTQPKYQVRGYSERRVPVSNREDRRQQQQQQQQRRGDDEDDEEAEHNVNQQEELNDGVPLKSPSDHSQDNANLTPPGSPQAGTNSKERMNVSDLDSPAVNGRKRKDLESSDLGDRGERRNGTREPEQQEEQQLSKGMEENRQEEKQQGGKGGPGEEYCMIKYIQRKAYSCVLRALRSRCTGLTWGQEKLISDLRDHLEIDNDVHIKQLELLDAWQLECHCQDCRS
ncbi:hypothetical protein SELMODRAFT_417830 [Selaginella moellendorffii]|uniref:ENT domain-containing protein n=1 Tax=Selaginella moellendorffii TaxID=88036 RepID=D8S3S6_SELML|nr:uncharacterized protein LOC9657811 [Selaginella moellendorffii]EFJ20807.1 hypothetical protein SELMODRAFT_417830 [Selaginella moellendorffii]|eukprot:XP_002978150.1 uncharacterized protein LOC9657811 [Selaginella moellendorffii]